MQMVLDCSDRVPGDLGNLFVGKRRQILEQKHLALIRWQLICGVLDALAQLGGQGFLIGAVARILQVASRWLAALVEHGRAELIVSRWHDLSTSNDRQPRGGHVRDWRRLCSIEDAVRVLGHGHLRTDQPLRRR